MTSELVKMSNKGQLVVPRDIREELGLSPGERFIAVPREDGVFFKKIDYDFDTLAKEIRRQFSKHGVKKKDVAEAIEWARKSSSLRSGGSRKSSNPSSTRTS